MQTRQLGSAGPTVSALGLGCMGMSPGTYGNVDTDEAIATIHAALDAGVTLLDTGDYYAMGHNELLIRDAIRDRPREKLQISVKYGGLRTPAGAWVGFDTRPEATKTFLAYSLQRLGTDHIDVYRPGRLDPNIPIEETIGGLKECVEAGWIGHIGLSEVGAETLRRAHAVHPICDLQIEYSLISRGIEDAILPTARELGVAITAYGVLSRGLLSGHWSPEREPNGPDFRAHAPRFSGENVQRNLELVERLRAIAEANDATVAQLAVAWVASRGDDVIPLVGARRRDQLEESLAGIELELSDEVLAEIEAAIPADAAAGERYAAPQMAMLDSER